MRTVSFSDRLRGGVVFIEEVGGWEEGEVQGDRVERAAVVLVEGAQAFLDFPFIEPLLESMFMESIKYLVLLLHLLLQTKLRHD